MVSQASASPPQRPEAGRASVRSRNLFDSAGSSRADERSTDGPPFVQGLQATSNAQRPHCREAARPSPSSGCLNLLGIFLHSILRHAVVGFRHALLRLGRLFRFLGPCVRRVVGLRDLPSSRAGGLGGGNRYASDESRTACCKNEITHFYLPVTLKELPITGHNRKGSIFGTQ